MQRRPIYGILPLLFLIAGLFFYASFCGQCSGTGRQLKQDTLVYSADLAASFEGNEVQSYSLYLYKILLVRGVLEKILKNESGNYVLTLGGQAPGKTTIDCNLDTLYNHRLLSLNNGDSITLRGTCAGRLLNVILLQCIIEKQ